MTATLVKWFRDNRHAGRVSLNITDQWPRCEKRREELMAHGFPRAISNN
jgi:hypothetical protein